MKKCKTCNKEYIPNPDLEVLKSFMSASQIDILKLIPNCDCLMLQAKLESERMEKELQRERLNNKIKKYKDISIVDSKFKEATFDIADMSDKHMVVMKKYGASFITKDTNMGIMLYGDVGTGKTYASACLSNYLMDNGKTVLALSLNNYINKLKREWAEAEKDVLEHVANCDLLVIDDFGSEKKTEWVLEKVFTLIDTRYRSKKPMIITTNLNFNTDRSKCEISKTFSIDGKDRIKDRIKEMCYPIPVKGESKRQVSRDEFIEFIS